MHLAGQQNERQGTGQEERRSNVRSRPRSDSRSRAEPERNYTSSAREKNCMEAHLPACSVQKEMFSGKKSEGNKSRVGCIQAGKGQAEVQVESAMCVVIVGEEIQEHKLKETKPAGEKDVLVGSRYRVRPGVHSNRM